MRRTTPLPTPAATPNVAPAAAPAAESTSSAWPLRAAVVCLLLVAASACMPIQAAPDASSERSNASELPVVAWEGPDAFERPSEETLREVLSKIQYEVTQNDATERPFQNPYWDLKDEGIYVDIVSGEPLFSSADKFESGTGWPSFTRPLEGEFVVERTDYKLGYPRTELRSKVADSHLGHVFSDGPEPTGLRYCINSAALHFIPAAELEARGYGEYANRFE